MSDAYSIPEPSAQTLLLPQGDNNLYADTSGFGFSDWLYATLFHPFQAFDAIAKNASVNTGVFGYAFAAVLLISGLSPCIKLAYRGGSLSMLLVAIPLSLIAGLVLWFLAGGIFGLLARSFQGHGRVRTFLTLSGLAVLPWLLMGPIALIKSGFGAGGMMIGILLSLLVWLWSVLLFGLAVMKTYDMTLDRVVIVLAMPWLMSGIFLMWLLGFLGTLAQLGPIR